MRCKFCKSTMMGQDNDRMGYNQYSRLYICINDNCKAAYEDWTDDKGVTIPDKSMWFDSEKEDYKK